MIYQRRCHFVCSLLLLGDSDGHEGHIVVFVEKKLTRSHLHTSLAPALHLHSTGTNSPCTRSQTLCCTLTPPLHCCTPLSPGVNFSPAAIAQHPSPVVASSNPLPLSSSRFTIDRQLAQTSRHRPQAAGAGRSAQSRKQRCTAAGLDASRGEAAAGAAHKRREEKKPSESQQAKGASSSSSSSSSSSNSSSSASPPPPVSLVHSLTLAVVCSLLSCLSQLAVPSCVRVSDTDQAGFGEGELRLRPPGFRP